MKKENNVLELLEKKISLETKNNFDPQEYFKNRDDLYVWSSFTERILPKAKKVKKGDPYTLSSFKLLKYAYDKEIEAELPKKHFFSENEVCAVIAELIAKQPKGEDGLLDTNWWNIFYTSDFVVIVLWGGDGWSVRGWRLDDSYWLSDLRVFSPATGK